MPRTYEIDSTEVLVNPNWRITDKINSRTTLSITVVDLQTLSDIDEGDTIEIIDTDGSTKIFSGIVFIKDKYEDIPGELHYAITAVDNSALADKRCIADAAENETASTIITNRILPILAEDGVTAGTITTGPTIKKAVFNYCSCAEALDYMKNVTGLNWKIDKDKKLQFFDRSANAAPWMLDDSVQHAGFRQRSSMEQYRNIQYIRAGKGKTNTISLEKPAPKPDGVSRNFVLRFPLAEKPDIFINSVQVSSSDIGVNGLDTGKKYYFAYDNNVITQDSGETVLSTSDVIEVSYKGLYPILTMVDNPAEISARALAETGTSGKYEKLDQEASINQSDQALEYGSGLIEKYGNINDVITFRTNVSGLEAGQLLSVDKTLFDIHEDFLIESVTITPDGPSNVEYSITALDGASLGGWEEFFKDLIKGQRKFVINENEVLILLNCQTETESYQGEVTAYEYAALYPANDLYPSNTMYPNTALVSEVTLND